jgi:hypothetical protein
MNSGGDVCTIISIPAATPIIMDLAAPAHDAPSTGRVGLLTQTIGSSFAVTTNLSTGLGTKATATPNCYPLMQSLMNPLILLSFGR